MRRTLGDIVEGIRAQPAGVAISISAIGIGIASLTVLMAVMGGLRDRADQMIDELGANVIAIINQAEVAETNKMGLTMRHASLLEQNLPGHIVATVRRYDVPTIGTNSFLSVVATDSSFAEIRQWQLSAGRFLDFRDIDGRERSAVISQTLSSQWGWKTGDIIMLRNIPFNVVGIVETGGTALDTEVGNADLILGERVVFVPKSLVPYWADSSVRIDEKLDAIFVKIPDSASLEASEMLSRRLLLEPGNHLDDISWVTPETLIQGINKLGKTITMAAGSVVALALLLAGTTLMSLMLNSVRSRVSEIGLRRALGASRQDIISMFLMEASLITGIAAVVAIGGTYLLLVLGRNALPVPVSIGSGTIIIPFVVAIILSITFSYWPARNAARITPSEALRSE
ncbi:MAG: ABC transporter permease [Proteobacteria bacterium]|nr:ABC transporter permease [Pseudomonadota bacterium]